SHHPCVAAASIIAKVTRDRLVRQLEERAGKALGSGYPSDPVTVGFFNSAVNSEMLPAFIRKSWEPVRRAVRFSKVKSLEEFRESDD
ncbi:MAG: ribonuclease HII, partial [Methanomassiliicoccales archaeon]